jgi:hypothetical protein
VSCAPLVRRARQALSRRGSASLCVPPGCWDGLAALGLSLSKEQGEGVGVADEYWGEEVVAFVVLDVGGELEAEALVATCRQRIASFKLPKRVFVVEDLPKNATGKIERGALRERAGREARCP